MLKKRNLLFLSLFIMSVLLLSSCFLNPLATEGILKGQVMVPEGSIQAKDLTGQALPDATVNIIDLSTGAIIASATTDVNGYYQVFVPAGGPYLLEAVKGEVKLQQITCPVEAGIEYDLGTVDCMTTSAAIIAQAMMDAGTDPADIDCTAIIEDSNFSNVSSIVCSTIQAGQDPTSSTTIQQAVEDFLNPPTPTPSTPPAPTTYTVTFDSNEGSAVSPITGIAYNATITLPTDPTKEGYTFGGWYKESECTDDWDFATDKVTSNVILYAKWTINSYTVTFKINGGDTEANPTTKTAAHGGNVGTLPTEPTRAGYAFAIWNTQAGGGGTKFTETTAVTADLAVYAQWTANNYDITFDKNDASATGTMAVQTIASGSSANLTACGFTKVGWKFDGWAKTSTGAIAYADQASYTMGTENVTLYAKWISLDYYVRKVGLDSNDGSDADPWLTIQHALSNTPDGGTIHVADGTYNESITFPDGKVITLQSVHDASSTIITGVHGSATVTCSNSPDGTTLQGFTINHKENETGRGINIGACYLTINSSTISDNSAGSGGGIYNYGGTITITGISTISDNSTDNIGGGIYNYGGTITITGISTISDNSAGSGGGIYNYGGTITITGGTISNNSASIASVGYGGGIYNWHATLTINGDSTISNNSANYGGGIFNYEDSTLTITDSTISNNSAVYDGGGIFNHEDSTLTITGSSVIRENSADNGSGGGIFNYGTITITGGTISGNSADVYRGGGIFNNFGTLTITGDSTISNNSAADGGGIYHFGDNTLDITGSTISGNSADDGGGIYLYSETDVTIGGSSDTDTGNFNEFTDNYKTGSPPSADQHIRNGSGDCHTDYPNNNFTYALRDTGPAGGLIFYINPNYIADGWRYLEAHPSDQSTSYVWNGSGIVGGTSVDIGTGEANTNAIVGQSAGNADSAAKLCYELEFNDYDDWFLPSEDELNLMYTNLKEQGVGNFVVDVQNYSWYWSSSEVDIQSARAQYFFSGDGEGIHSTFSKANTLHVRAVRAF